MADDRPQRHARIEELLHKKVGEIIATSFESEKAMVTVSAVSLSPTRQHATVYITVYPFEESDKVIAALEKNVAKVQHKLNQTLKMRPVPKITFKIDTSEEQARKILDILDKEV